MPIGPSARQLNGDLAYSGGAENQLTHWQKAGWLTDLPTLTDVPRAPVWNDPATGDLNARARTWLDINCAHCHRPDGPASTSGLNLSIHERSPIAWGIMKTPVAAGRGSGGRRYDIVPGRPDESILLYRVESTDPGVMMPEVARKVTHNEGVALVRNGSNRCLMTPATPINAVDAPTRADWRQWLADNHATEKGIWLKIFKKNGSRASVTYSEAVDEALCFGWIDSSAKKGDDQHYLQYFAKRNPKSNWSRVNKDKVEKLTKAGLITDAGQAMIDLAKRTGTWTALDDVDNLVSPPDLQKSLNANPTAKAYFSAFPRSAKRGILEWLLNAKMPATRAKRIADIVTKAECNERANQYTPKGSSNRK